MEKTEQERFRDYIKKLLEKEKSRRKSRALTRLNDGKMPKRTLAKQLVQTTAYQKMLSTIENETKIPQYQMALSDDGMLWTLYKQLHTSSGYQDYCKHHELPGEKDARLQEEQAIDEMAGEVTQYLASLDLKAKMETIVEEVLDQAVSEIENYFRTANLFLDPRCLPDAIKKKQRSRSKHREVITADNIHTYVDSLFLYDGGLDDEIVQLGTGKKWQEWSHVLAKALIQEDAYLSEHRAYFNEWYFHAFLDMEDDSNRLYTEIRKAFTPKEIWSLLKQNPHLRPVFRELNARDRRKQSVGSAILDRIPEKVIDLYPLARSMHRHFVLHLGGTNSGKTYSALEALKKADSGVYLAPLRLLAYEGYERLNREGYPCSLLTGEESSPIEGASFTASTMEMADYTRSYEIAVIDEAQMVEDEARGGAWTSAILGIQAETIHICASPNAKRILTRMIQECGDSYEIFLHERKTPLLLDEGSFQFPSDVKKGDALIVFSRKNVHAVAAELQEKDYKCALIYGALPYDVRHRQAELFATGKMDVVVATDAIGMGMNLPIRRVVFLEQKKFDGKDSRFLRSDEVKQIAGRAGRLGMYEEGYVNSYGGKKQIRAKLRMPDMQIKKAVLGFPKALLGIDAKLSDIIQQWTQIKIQEGYRRAVTEREYELCLEMEKWCEDKYFIYNCITIAYDEKDADLHRMWLQMCQDEWEGRDYPVSSQIPRWMDTDLKELEQNYHVCDLLYAYCDRFGYPQYIPDIQDAKEQISEKIQRALEKEKLQQRTCRHCGQKLPWNYPYGLCSECFDAKHGRILYTYD